MKKFIILFSILIVFLGCKLEKKNVFLDESSVINIAVTQPLADRKSEISSLAWYNDYLIILPQYPNRFPNNSAKGSLFAIPKKQLDKYLSGENKQPIEPIKIPFYDDGLSDLDGFEGYEAICFIKDNIYLTIESSPDKMLGYLVKGKIKPDLTEITMDFDKKAKIQPQAEIPNACYETMFVYDDKIYTIYEANGKNVNPHPKVLVYSNDLKFIGEYEIPNIEYRITDATCVDDNKVYLINYFWPGDQEYYNPATDEIAEKYGVGKTHYENKNVERVICFDINDKIRLANKPPTYMKLLGNNTARNWEGIVKYKKGFILATDKYPTTIIGYIESK